MLTVSSQKYAYGSLKEVKWKTPITLDLINRYQRLSYHRRTLNVSQMKHRLQEIHYINPKLKKVPILSQIYRFNVELFLI